MSTTRTAKTHWEGNLTEGAGRVNMESSGVGAFEVRSLSSGTNSVTSQPSATNTAA